MPTTQTFERQKMTTEIWEKLKSHIMKQREKRKQEQEQDAEQERHRREQELKRKRDATTLEDIKEQLGRLETELSELKKQKHELFLQLKKVLNEDDERKKKSENEMLAAKHALMSQTQNQPYNQFLVNQNAVVNTRIQQLNTPTSQQFNSVAIQQQLLNKHSPITTVVTSLPNQPNFINSVMAHSLPQQPQMQNQQQQQPQQLTNKQRASLKRPLDRSSPQTQPQQSAVPYNGTLQLSNPNNYKPQMSNYPPNVQKIAPTSQPFFPQNQTRLNIPVSQPYHFLPPGTDTASLAEHANVINSGQMNAQALSSFQAQELMYQSQFLKMGLPPQSLMSIQNASMKGGITAGFPPTNMQQRPPSNQPNTSSVTNSNTRFPNRYMY